MLTESTNGSLKLQMKQVSHESHGEYLCTAYNVAGVVQKKFTVIVEGDPEYMRREVLRTIVSLPSSGICSRDPHNRKWGSVRQEHFLETASVNCVNLQDI
ncbi:unnamed protein product [Allacma fusca]|uniref:Immunoglobulin I-set domain-containing protein n=1 Tax=Allacma fusca TaxID=39272 RepID=A0A8J2JJV7_9HEXA|nr:unnamed protein product [Allacma fusca]